MSVLSSLAREHEIFRRLIDRLVRAVRGQEDAARAELRTTLLVLLPALDRHEEIEDGVFAGLRGSGARLVRSQHRRVDRLKSELRDALRDEDKYAFEALQASVGRFADELRAHFQAEETALWPRLEGRPFPASAARRASAAVRRLEVDVAKLASAALAYAGEWS